VRKLIIPLLISMLVAGIYQPVQAQEEVQVVGLRVTHRFGERIDLEARIDAESDIQSLQVVFSSKDQPSFVKDPVTISPDGEVAFSLDLSQRPIQAFSEIEIHFEILLTDGSTINTEPTRYYYDDNRFDWQIQQSEAFTVFWYQDDPDLGDEIIAVANDGWERIRSQFVVPEPEGILIYAYSNIVDMQDTLVVSGGSFYWIAGHAVSDLGVIIVSIPPGPEQSLEIRRQIPHELMHVLLYRKLGPDYSNLPRWLNEGLASIAELSPNPDYQILLERAYEREALIPIRDLCASFPVDAANFQLSYAEAYDFTWYLQQTYGNEVIEALIQSYAGGLDCEKGIEPVLDRSLSELEAEWRQDVFNEDRSQFNWVDVLPFVIIVGFAFIAPIGLVVLGIGRRRTSGPRGKSSK
jgi:hypothetical protein